MSKVTFIKFAKNIKKRINIVCDNERSPYVSYTRRINRVKTSARVCAMTFDDGPMNLPPIPANSSTSLTEVLLKTLEKHNAKGTFDIIGTTASNYPDVEGKIGTPSWGGVKFDHYPSFGSDEFAGAVNCPDLIKKILNGGHQLTNHTYSHILYGKKNIIYSKRQTLSSFENARSDLLKLDKMILDNNSYKMKFSRPPHYVDRIEKGLNTYDLYALENYLYLGASFDGAGWLPCSSNDEEILAMTEPLEKALSNNPDELCGQIIFQKDGYNMALRTPVATALDKQLDILDYYGYNVITVDELVERYPFSDVDEFDNDFEFFKSLAKDYAVCYTDNTLRPDAPMTLGELAVLIAPKSETVNKRITAILNDKKTSCPLPLSHPYSGAISWAIDNRVFDNITKSRISSTVTPEDFNNLGEIFNVGAIKTSNFSRRNILKSIK